MLFSGQRALEESLVRGEELVCHSGAEDGVGGLVAVLQDLPGHIHHVLVGKGSEQVKRPLVRMGGQEALDNSVVAGGFDEELSLRSAVILGEGGHIGLTDLVFMSGTLAVGFPLFLSYFWNIRSADGRDYHHALRLVGMVGCYHDGDEGILSERDFRVAVFPVFRGPREHVSHAGGEEGLAFLVGVFRESGIELGVVVDVEVHEGAVNRIARVILHYEIHFRCLGIIVYQVDLSVVGTFHDLLFRPIVASENPCVHQQATARGGVEPSEVKHSLRLAGSEEVPCAVSPSLHPGVIVVGVGPAGSVNLPGGDAD